MTDCGKYCVVTNLAAQIPEVLIPEHINAPRQYPVHSDDPFTAGAQNRPMFGWRDMVAHLPPMPAQLARSGRPRAVLSGPHAT